MSLFGAVITNTMQALQTEFTLLGATFSYWQVLIWSIFVGIAVWIVCELWGN